MTSEDKKKLIWRRVAAVVVDSVLAYAVFLLLVMSGFVSFLMSLLDWDYVSLYVFYNIYWAYSVLAQWMFGSTLGKFALGLQVTPVLSGKNGFIQILLRNIGPVVIGVLFTVLSYLTEVGFVCKRY